MTQPATTVVVPTIGRPQQLRKCLRSLTACVPSPSEIVVVDQSGRTEVPHVVERFGDFGARAIDCDGRGPALARNLGLERARHEFVLFTDDDCTVSADWIGTASELMARDPTAIFTGSVLPAGDPLTIPSTIDEPVPHDYTDEIRCDVLYSNNMVCARSRVLASGGFDNRLFAAEDNDLCYRWLRSGRHLLYEPSLRVWHHDWRRPKELKVLYRHYGRGQGYFYAKHLRQGDLRMLRFIGRDVLGIAGATASAGVRRQPKRALPTWGLLRGLPEGLWQGWREFAPR